MKSEFHKHTIFISWACIFSKSYTADNKTNIKFIPQRLFRERLIVFFSLNPYSISPGFSGEYLILPGNQSGQSGHRLWHSPVIG